MFEFLKPTENTPNQNNYSNQSNMPMQRFASPITDAKLLGIEIEQEVEELILAFQGKKYSQDGTEIVDIPGGIKIMNANAASIILGMYKVKMSKGNATTMFNAEEKILRHCLTFAENLNELLCSRYREFEISEDFFDIIIDTLADNFELFLRKSLGDRQRGYIHSGNGEPLMPEQKTETGII